jgi:hypothetical protein
MEHFNSLLEAFGFGRLSRNFVCALYRIDKLAAYALAEELYQEEHHAT